MSEQNSGSLEWFLFQSSLEKCLFFDWTEPGPFPRSRMSNFAFSFFFFFFFLQFCMARWLSISDPPPFLCWSMSSLLEGQSFCRLPGLRSPCQSLLSAAEPLMPLARKWKKLPNNLQIDANVVTSNSCCSAPLFVKTSSCVEPSWLKFNSVHLTKMFWAAALYSVLDKALGKWSIQDSGASCPHDNKYPTGKKEITKHIPAWVWSRWFQ